MRSPLSCLRLVALLVTVAAVAPTGGALAGPAGPASAPRTPYDLVKRCLALQTADGRAVVRAGGGYRAERSPASPFFLQATDLGRYLLHDPARGLLASDAYGATRRTVEPGPSAVWAPERITAQGLVLRSTATGRALVVRGDGSLQTVDGAAAGTRLALVRTTGCTPYPEAETGASGTPFRGTRADGTVEGFADPHLHVTSDLRAGGSVIHGTAFDPYGVPVALGGDEDTHGPQGSLDVTGNLLRDGSPVGTHDTGGWPDFRGWPTFDTNTHQQVYYRWLERMWLAGQRVTTAMLVEDEPLCEIEPFKAHSCDEADTLTLQAERMRELQDYVDAQSGGPGRGWLRLVTDPAQARRVVEQGKLAVLLGAESSNLFGCSQVRGVPQCDRADIDAGISRLQREGISTVFLAHWVDNALGGAALEGEAKGQLIGAMNTYQTGEAFQTGPCPLPGQGEEPSPAAPEELSGFPLLGRGVPLYPAGKQCNVRGLTDLGRYAVQQLFRAGILIEADHLSEIGRQELLTLAEQARRPLVSSHTDTGGTWAPSEVRRLVALGGFPSATRGLAPQLAEDVLRFARQAAPGTLVGVGLGTDTGGFATLPEPAPASVVRPLAYPFTSRDGAVRFERQRTGTRTFDLNRDGVAHYGLFADQLAQLRAVKGGPEATELLFRSAEAYLRTWTKARTGSTQDPVRSR